MLLTRNSMLETMREDFVMAARAKGLPERAVRDKHVARNALLPVVTSFIFSLAFAVDGGVITESIFSWPGMGQTLVSATLTEDLPLAVGAFVFVGIFRASRPPCRGHSVCVSRPEDPVLMAMDSAQTVTSTSVWRARLRLASRSVRENWGLFVRTRIGLLGLAIIAMYAVLAAAHPVLMNTVWEPRIYDPVIGYAFDETKQPAPPSLKHPLGTDPLGRDILSQLMFSARSEFLLGLLAATVTVVIGTSVGAIAAYFGGWVDTLLMRLADIMIMMPAISVLIVLSALIGVEHFELALVNRHPLRLWCHWRGAEVAGSVSGRQAVHRRREERGRRTLPHHLGTHRAESPAAFFPIHDVHRYQCDLLRSGAELPRPAQRADELGADDTHHGVGGIPVAGRRVLVADIPGQPVDHVAMFRLLSCRSLARRGGESEVAETMTTDPVLAVDDLRDALRDPSGRWCVRSTASRSQSNADSRLGWLANLAAASRRLR